MALNNCSTDSNKFGPPQQTLFLGCSIIEFNISVGWNEQVSQLQVNLVRDTCSVPDGGNPKVYYDAGLVRQTTTGPDPGFTYPNIGAPVYFRINNFEFSGIIQSFVQNNNFNGNPTYSVTVVDPREILRGTQLIIGNYAGSVNGTPNVFNVFGYLESFGTPDPLTLINGAPFGSPAGAYGGAYTNDNGMQWNLIAAGTMALTSALPIPTVNMWSTYGRMAFRGGGTGGYGVMPSDDPITEYCYYFVDLTAIPEIATFCRIAGTSVSLLDAISQICQEVACDYYIELVPIMYGGEIVKIIKVQTASRILQPDLTQIESFISNIGNVPSSSQGQEMRNEVTSSLIIGGPQQNIYQASSDYTVDDTSAILPFFGLDENGDAIVPWLDENGFLNFEVSLDELNLQLINPLDIDSAVITEPELMAVIGGKDSWLAYEVNAALGGGDLGVAMTDAGIYGNIAGAANPILAAGFGAFGAVAMDLNSLQSLFNDSTDPVTRDIETIFSWISTYARDFYGRQFMVRIPYTVAKFDPESELNGGQAFVQTSEEPSDGGWTDSALVLGLPHPTVLTDFFTLEDNRLGCFVAFNDISDLDPSIFNKDEMGIVDGTLYCKAQISPQLVYLDSSTLYSPRVVISLSQAITKLTMPEWLGDIQPAFAGAAAAAAAQHLAAGDLDAAADAASTVADIQDNVDMAAIQLGFGTVAAIFDAAAVPLKSNIIMYGPWNVIGPAGVTAVEQDDGLTPWEYGSSVTMNLAGASRALNDTASLMQIGEMGSIEVPGYPEIPLGAELGAVNGGFYGGASYLIENRTMSFNSFSQGGYDTGTTGQDGWTGLYGPNITSITVEESIQGITTNYQMRTFTPQFGIFTKNNAERLKHFGQMGLRQQKQFRLFSIKQTQLAAIAQFQQNAQADKRHTGRGDIGKAHSPHEILIGQMLDWGDEDTTRSVVVLDESRQIAKELTSEVYAEKAFMSLDGLLRPVSMDGDGGLPPYFASADDEEDQVPSPAGAWPPMNLPDDDDDEDEVDDSEVSTCYSILINTDYLNPMCNPDDLERGLKHGTADGHDICVLGRYEEPPSENEGSLNMYTAGAILDSESQLLDYTNDYRFMALRGPLVLTGWGYDTNGKPIPNAADNDDDAAAGVFTNEALTDEFLENWLRKPNTWPVAPVDLRMDRKRGVWVSPPAYKLVVAQHTSVLEAYGECNAQIVYGDDIYDADGNQLTPGLGEQDNAPTITINDVIGVSYPTGCVSICYYDVDNQQYHVLNNSYVKPYQVYRGILQAELSYGSSAKAQIYGLSGTGTADVTVNDWLLKSSSTALPSGSKCFVMQDFSVGSGAFYLIEASCP